MFGEISGTELRAHEPKGRVALCGRRMDRGAYWFTSSTSFANPAVTIARTLGDSFAGIAPASAPAFVAMQLIGTVIALLLVKFFYPHPRPEIAHD